MAITLNPHPTLTEPGPGEGFLNEHGQEILDDTPMAPPIGYKRQPSLVEQIRQMVKSEQLAQAAREQGFDTFEEADDFNIPDDPVDPSSPWEDSFEPPAPPPAPVARAAAPPAAAASGAAPAAPEAPSTPLEEAISKKGK